MIDALSFGIGATAGLVVGVMTTFYICLRMFKMIKKELEEQQ